MGDISKAPKIHQTRTLTAAATLEPVDSGVIFLNNSGTFTVTLPPAAVSAGVWFQFVKVSSAAAAVTLDGNASETINGSTTFASIDAQYDAATIVCNGTAWFIADSKIA